MIQDPVTVCSQFGTAAGIPAGITFQNQIRKVWSKTEWLGYLTEISEPVFVSFGNAARDA
ncbi:MAG: hypothetical protein ACI8P0_003423 [Planctomycetaceae bacterium]|jgi:hypothetical protein